MAPMALAAGDDGVSSGRDSDGDPGGGPDASAAERAAMVVSVAVTVALFAFVVWSAATGATEARPATSVDRVQTTDEGRTEYAVLLVNPGDRGLERTTVVVECGDPPRTLAFEHVPPQSERRATVICPSRTGPPPAAVVSWTSG